MVISIKKPHKRVGRDTIRKWTKMSLEKAGFDLDRFSAHSTRSASTSKAKAKGVSLGTILKPAGWKGSSTFAKFFHKRVEMRT